MKRCNFWILDFAKRNHNTMRCAAKLFTGNLLTKGGVSEYESSILKQQVFCHLEGRREMARE